MKGRPHQKNGHWYIIVPRKKQSPKWISTGIKVVDMPEAKFRKKIPQLISDYVAQNGPITDETIIQPVAVMTPGSDTNSLSPLLADIVEQYLTVVKVKQNTHEKYSYAARNHIIPYFRSKKITVAQLTTPDLQAYFDLKLKKLSKKTLKDHKTVLNGTIRYAIRPLKLITDNPALEVQIGTPDEPPIRFYDHDQLSLLFHKVSGEGDHIVTPIILAAYYGLRREEVSGLQWDAVDFKNKTIVICRTAVKVAKGTLYSTTTKTKSSYRTMPLFPEVEKYLKGLLSRQMQMKATLGRAYPKHDDVVRWQDGHLVDPNYITQKFTKLIRKYNLPKLTFHQLRHSTASLLVNEGYSLVEIKEWLGHADIKSTLRYSHLVYKAKIKMANTIGASLQLPEISS